MNKNFHTIFVGMCVMCLSQESMAQITKLIDHKNHQSDPIGTFQGIQFREAGFSGLYPIPNTNGEEFWTVSDRGVNVDAANANPAACRPTYDKIYGFAGYAPKIHRIRLNTADSSVQILKTISLKRPDGTTATGLINPTGFGSTAAEVASIDTVQSCVNFATKTAAKDIWGIDSEGLVVDRDGNFWICEEGGPTIWKVATTGVVLKRFTPYAQLVGAQSIDVPIDTVFKYRKNNRGFEGIALAPNGKIYAIIQSPILYPTKSVGEGTRIHRILEINPANNATRMLAYLNDGIVGSGSNQIRLRDWKIGDLAAISDTTFLVIEAGLRGSSDIKKIYKINIAAATAVHAGLYGTKTLEALVDSAGLANNGIVPVKKTLFLDLLANGWPAELDKAEGLAILNDSTIAVGNDNDYGQTTLNGAEDGIAIATGKLSHVFLYGLKGINKLNGYQSADPIGTTGPSTARSPYVTPAAPGVKLTSILSAGDTIGGYKMAGTPDGTGAFDNGDGTFTLLVNHEFGPTAGAVRAHGSKGAFVSKWTIRKSDLGVVSGADLIQHVNLWNGTGYTTYNASNPSTLAAFGRFCSADLPKVSAFYNSVTGLGTQERIFMNGEESGTEGRLFAHIATGPNAGTSYELPHLGKYSTENSVACPSSGNKTVVATTDDATPGQVYFYIGTKTNSGTEVDKAGLTNGKLYGVSVAGLLTETDGSYPADNTPFALLDLGQVHNMSGAALNTASNNAGVTNFLRPEDGAWDPSNPNDFYFATTNGFANPSRLWKLHFTDISNPELGGTISAVLNGTEGQRMFDNLTIDNHGHVLLVEDVGGNAHLGKTWQYTIANDQLKLIASHDSSRFISGRPNFLTQDEEASGIIDAEEILGAGHFLLVDQAHYSQPGEIVEGGQLLSLFNPDTYEAYKGQTGPSSSQSPYNQPSAPGVKYTSILTTGDAVAGYKMAGTPDGLGAFDNGNGTFTLLMNHEFVATAGIARAHGSKGSFVSKWEINKADLSILSGTDLIQKVKLWNGSGYTAYNASNPSPLTAFGRFCSADLPAVSAFFNAATGLGTKERIFMNGEEANDESRAFAHIVTGANGGTSYELPHLGKAAWENSVASPASGNKTVVGLMNDGTDGQVYFYVGTKTNTGTEIDKAGLTNGRPYGVKVDGFPVERINSSTSAPVPASGTRFTLVDLGSVENTSGAAFNTASNAAGVTKFARPEDGAWDPASPNDFYFATTDQIDQVNDGVGAQVGRSKVWRVRFDDVTQPELGGTIEAVVDGTEGINMLDNLTIDNFGHILLVEDVGNSVHNGKTWEYTIATDQIKQIGHHDVARFGDVGVPATAPYNVDEETSGILDVSDILGAGMFLVVDQAHYAQPGELVEGGQLLALFNPSSYKHLPELTSFSKTGNEDDSLAFAKTDFTGAFADADNQALANVKITALPTKGNLYLNGQVTTVGQIIPAAQLPKLVYLPNTHVFGTDSLKWNGSDGTNYAAKVAKVTLNIASVNDFPTTSVTSPVANAQFAQNSDITIEANASDVDGTVKKVLFYIGATKIGEDAVAPYSFVWANAPTGNYNVYVKAIDNLNATTTSSTVAIKVNPNVAPTVSIVSPTNGSTAAAGTITLEATAADADGIVKNVEFFSGANKVGQDSIAPFLVVLSEVEPGAYAFTAKATDNKGAATTSAIANVTIEGCTGNGSITRELFNNIPGFTVANLTGNSKYPNNPDFVATKFSFEGTANTGDNYGSRMIGFICAPATGDYTFWIAADDKAELWLSTDANPANKQLIASVPQTVNPRAYQKYPQQKSALVRLVKGVTYFVMALHKEATGTDHISVAWTLPNGVFQNPVPGSALSPWTGGTVAREGEFFDFNSGDAFDGVLVSPVPAHDKIQVTFFSENGGQAEISLKDALSNEVLATKTGTKKGANTVELLLNNLSSGVYTVQVVNGESRHTQKIVIETK